MKKLLALCLVACISLSILVSCGDVSTSSTSETTGATETYPKSYEVKDGVLLSCVGQADENGVYVIPETITAIGEFAFSGDETIKEVVIGSHVKWIGSGSFQGCTSLEKVVIEEGVEKLGSYTFYDCTSLTEISLPSTIDYLNPYTFYRCSALQDITIDHIRYIDVGAFWYCSSLERVTFSEDLEYIASWAFAQNTNFSESNLGELRKLTTIADYAFTGCSMLRSITIPEGVTLIGKLSFYDCSRLSEVNIADTVKMIDYAAFNFTPWFQESSEEYLIVGDGVLIKCGVHPAYIDLADKNIKAIGGAAFWNAAGEGQAAEYGYKYAANLETIVFPETVTAIGTSAFAGCYSLKEVVLPAGVTEIGENAFNIYAEDVDTQAKIDYSACENLKTIGAYAFQGCYGMTSMELPKSVEKVGSYAFSATTAYETFMQNAVKAETEADRYFITGDGILLAAYVADGQTKITVPSGVKMLAGAVFSGWDLGYIPEDTSLLSDSGRSKYNISYQVKEVELPDTLTTIGDSAFYRMLSVEKVALPKTVTWIDDSAFAFCAALTDFSGGKIQKVGHSAFAYCVSIPSFTFAESTTSIGDSVFAGCSSLKTVYLPKTLEFPGTDLFNSECVSLTSLSLSPEARVRIHAVLGGISQEIKVFYYNE